MRASIMIRLNTAARDIRVVQTYKDGTEMDQFREQAEREVRLSISEEDARTLYAQLGHKLRSLSKEEKR